MVSRIRSTPGRWCSSYIGGGYGMSIPVTRRIGAASEWKQRSVTRATISEDTLAKPDASAPEPASKPEPAPTAGLTSIEIFPPVSRRYWESRFWLYNLRAVLAEIAILGPAAAAAVWWSRRAR